MEIRRPGETEMVNVTAKWERNNKPAPATLKRSTYVSGFGAWNYWRNAIESREMHYGRFEAGEEIEALVEERWKEQYPDVQFVENDNPYKEQIENCKLAGKPVVMIVDKKTGGSSDSTAAEAKAAGMTAISTQRTLTPEGIDITNNGVEAQVQVNLTAEDIAAGHDSQMVRAVGVVREMIANST